MDVAATGKPAVKKDYREPADLKERVFARTVDVAIVMAVNVVGIHFLLFGTLLTIFHHPVMRVMLMMGRGVLIVSLLYGYFLLLERKTGQTFGKMLFNIETVGPDRKQPTLKQVARRNVWVLSLGFVVIPVVGWGLATLAFLAAATYIGVTIDQSGSVSLGWHDDFAGGTQVLSREKR